MTVLDCGDDRSSSSTLPSSADITSLTLLPSHLRIADRTAVTAITKRTNTGEYPVNPRIAYFREDHLAFLPLGAAAFGMLYGEGDREDSE